MLLHARILPVLWVGKVQKHTCEMHTSSLETTTCRPYIIFVLCDIYTDTLFYFVEK